MIWLHHLGYTDQVKVQRSYQSIHGLYDTPYHNYCFHAVASLVVWVLASNPMDPGSIPRWAVCCCFPEQGTLLTLLQSTQLY